MANTIAQDVFDFFESNFRDKQVIPRELELVWLRRAIARYAVEIEPLSFNVETEEFDCNIGDEVISVLAAYIKLFYQEREVSKVNKRVSLVSKDVSIDGNNGTKNAVKNELDYDVEKAAIMTQHLKQTAYI